MSNNEAYEFEENENNSNSGLSNPQIINEMKKVANIPIHPEGDGPVGPKTEGTPRIYDDIKPNLIIEVVSTFVSDVLFLLDINHFLSNMYIKKQNIIFQHIYIYIKFTNPFYKPGDNQKTHVSNLIKILSDLVEIKQLIESDKTIENVTIKIQSVNPIENVELIPWTLQDILVNCRENHTILYLLGHGARVTRDKTVFIMTDDKTKVPPPLREHQSVNSETFIDHTIRNPRYELIIISPMCHGKNFITQAQMNDPSYPRNLHFITINTGIEDHNINEFNYGLILSLLEMFIDLDDERKKIGIRNLFDSIISYDSSKHIISNKELWAVLFSNNNNINIYFNVEQDSVPILKESDKMEKAMADAEAGAGGSSARAGAGGLHSGGFRKRRKRRDTKKKKKVYNRSRKLRRL